MRVVLDTNAYSDWLRDGRWSEGIANAEEVIIPAIVLGELREGFLRGSKADFNETVLREILEQPFVTIGVVGEATSHHFAMFKKHLKDAGTPIPVNDVWIAACCFELSAELLTSDRHFKNLPQVRVRFPEGE